MRCFYADIIRSDDDRLYRSRKNILLQEEEHLFVYVMGDNIGPKLPDVAIDRDHISFRIQADIFTFGHIRTEMSKKFDENYLDIIKSLNK